MRYALLAILLVSCKPTCQPGSTQDCKCPPDHKGVQVCNENGKAWNPCDCGLGEAMAKERLTEKVVHEPAIKDHPVEDLTQSKLETYRKKLLEFLRNANVRDRQLEAGVWRGKEEDYDDGVEGVEAMVPEARLEEALLSYGDLDGNGLDEIVSIVTEEGGGNATWRDLVIAGAIGEEMKVVATERFADRTRVLKVEIRDGIIELELVEHAEDDPECCPSVNTRRRYRLTDGRLELVERTHEGEKPPRGIE